MLQDVAEAPAMCLTGVPALVALLEHADWCDQLCSLLVQLQGGSPSDPGQSSTPGLAAAALRFTHNVAVLSPADLVPRLGDVVHTLVQSSDELSPGRGWRDWPPADTVPCWTEALRLCTALVQLEC
ncbi:uncharacterized protein LOC119089306 [Pollicipes pollicipes]|uniref:uncharacterized protein LOC119089306 n=1 Tax=Pollicipes pollicipes TaxID=41117 RepID=UPI001885907C|nr:uncharacterized protein LOC119089306 [Pollicipes pollicipes]